MEKELLFAKTLEYIKSVAKDQNYIVSKEQVETAFAPLEFGPEQLEMVYDYLRKQKIGIEEAVDPDAFLSEEDVDYLDTYLEELKYLPEATAAQKQWKDVTLRQLSNYSTDARVSPFVLYNAATTTFSKYYNLFLYDKADLNSTLKKISGQLDILVEEGMAYAQQASSK